MKTALVLSAGGMFGAYQAGAWSVIAEWFQPDLVVGASVGAINGWAIAGGCPAEQLVERWLTLECAAHYRVRWPRYGGILDSGPLMRVFGDLFAAYTPKTEYALVATELRRLRPRIFTKDQITFDLLRATIAIPAVFDQVRVGGKLYTDGGLLNALPIGAAVDLGAEAVVAINALTANPGVFPTLFVDTVRAISRYRPANPSVPVIRIAPTARLGAFGREMLYWSRRNAERWIEQGRRDASAQKHSIQKCFERE